MTSENSSLRYGIICVSIILIVYFFVRKDIAIIFPIIILLLALFVDRMGYSQ